MRTFNSSATSVFVNYYEHWQMTHKNPLAEKTCLVFLAVCSPVEELLREAVLHVAGRRLLLYPALQQHLLVHLPLLLLLFQVLLHAKPLPVELLVLLRGVVELQSNHQNELLSGMEPLWSLQEWL